MEPNHSPTLDKKLKDSLLDELRTILHETHIPAIYVTHDQEEAFAIADRVLILHDGQIIHEGTPADVWTNPGTAYVAEFLGLGNVIDGEVVSSMQEAERKMLKVKTEYGLFEMECDRKISKGEKVKLLVRPLSVKDEANTVSGIVTDVIFQQDRFKVTLENGLYIYLDEAPNIGERVSVKVKVECLA